MPTYEYKCGNCGLVFEEFQSMKDEPIGKCPNCGGKVRKLISAGAGMIFKGSGFYLTDYKKSNSSPAKSDATAKPSSKEASAKTEKAPPAKTETTSKTENPSK